MARKPTVQIVEDEPGIADTLQYALCTDGFEPLWCATGEAALQPFLHRYNWHRPHCALNRQPPMSRIPAVSSLLELDT
jgi:DNA-binding NtrC family response regulator